MFTHVFIVLDKYHQLLFQQVVFWFPTPLEGSEHTFHTASLPPPTLGSNRFVWFFPPKILLT